MKIELKQARLNDTDVTAFFTLTDGQGNFYDWHGDIPKDVDVQKHLEANIRWYLRCIRMKEYPGAQYQSSPGEDELERFEEWIKDGCMNRDEEGQYEEKIEKVPWKGTHPPKKTIIDDYKISEEMLQELENAKTIEELKLILMDILKAGD